MNSHAAIDIKTTPEGAKAAAVLRAEDLWKSYEDGSIQVLNGVDFEALPAQAVALCGPSGCGKSTLLHLLGGLDEPTRGRILVHGEELRGRRRAQHFLRHEAGFVFQLHNLIPDLTLEENCLIPTVAAGTSRKDALTRLHELTERTGLSHRLKQRIQKLSGRTSANRPVPRADEPAGHSIGGRPTGSLDERTSRQIFDLLLELARIDGITLVMATHDRGLAAQCDRLVEMRDGKVCE